MGGELYGCSFGGDEYRMDLMVVQRRFGFLEASLMRSRLDAANDVVINYICIVFDLEYIFWTKYIFLLNMNIFF